MALNSCPFSNIDNGIYIVLESSLMPMTTPLHEEKYIKNAVSERFLFYAKISNFQLYDGENTLRSME